MVEKKKHRKLLALGAIAAAGVLVAGTASAQNWPTRAIRIINPFPAGGGTDAFARPMAALMPTDLGQQVLIENLGGAGGTLGAGTASRAPGDGYTWFMGAVHHTIAETLYRKLSYSLERDFVPVTLAASVPSAVVVHPSVPAKTIKELIALDKRSPGSINYGSAGYGTTHHMNGELFNLITGTKLTHVPYKGAGPLTPALLSGEVAMAFDGMGTAGPNVKAGKLRALAVTTAKRSDLLPEVPTLQESGVDVNVTTWYALWGIKGTPQPIVDRMYQVTAKTLQAPQIKKIWDSLGATVGGQSPAEFGKFVRGEIETWGKVVKASGAKVEN
ncbi:MAG: tripartite tricarboxylate transporter substrate binding protein [Burkholderiales bacterium]|nr:tripartite tricarboxylate transporter substrate binding protein [Burkholderiales bacterium]